MRFHWHAFAARRSRLAQVSDAIQRRPNLAFGSTMPTVKARAAMILGKFEQAQTELLGKAVILTDGKAVTVESVLLDEMHGLRISIRGHDGKWPVSTIKFAQTDWSRSFQRWQKDWCDTLKIVPCGADKEDQFARERRIDGDSRREYKARNRADVHTLLDAAPFISHAQRQICMHACMQGSDGDLCWSDPRYSCRVVVAALRLMRHVSGEMSVRLSRGATFIAFASHHLPNAREVIIIAACLIMYLILGRIGRWTRWYKS
jgi:hypothetical protein